FKKPNPNQNKQGDSHKNNPNQNPNQNPTNRQDRSNQNRSNQNNNNNGNRNNPNHQKNQPEVKDDAYDLVGIVSAEGVLEIIQEGYGFLRSSDYNYLPSP